MRIKHSDIVFLSSRTALIMKKSLLFLLIIPLSVSLTLAQKVKYKDIFPDLETRKFNKVEPTLRAFLANEKNSEHANANYYMGVITEAKFLLSDVIKDTTSLYTFGDTAVSFFKKSLALITEKEIKKNEKYYQVFFRRDLRTGEFGIKLSDVHLDIEKKIESIESRMKSVRDFHQSVQDLTNLESGLLDMFNDLVNNSTSFGDYLMQSEIEAITVLGDIQSAGKAFKDKADNALEVAKELGVTDYYQDTEYKPIEEFKELPPVFPEDDQKITTYDFSTWASETKSKLNGEIFELKDAIKEFDKNLSSSKVKIKGKAIPELPLQLPESIQGTLSQYDEDGVAARILKTKMKENFVLFYSDTLFNKALLDSTLIANQVKMSDSIVNGLEEILTLSSVTDDEVVKGGRYYGDYYSSRFEGVKGVQKYLGQVNRWAKRTLTDWKETQAFWDLRNNWGISGNDTIPLRRVDEDFSGNYVTNGFLETPGDSIISWGVKADSLLGYIAKFGPDRKLIWQFRFESDILDEEGKRLFESDTLHSGEGELIFYLFNDEKEEADLTVVNTALSGAIKWTATASAKKKPEYSTYSPAIQETIIFLYPQEAYPLPSGELGYITINRNGEVR